MITMKYAISTENDFVIKSLIEGAPEIEFEILDPGILPEDLPIPVITERLDLCYKGNEISQYNKQLFGDQDTTKEEKLNEVIRVGNSGEDRLCSYQSTITIFYPNLTSFTYIGYFYGYVSNTIKGVGLDYYDPVLYIPTFGLTLAEIADKYANNPKRPERNLIRIHQKESIKKCLKAIRE